MTLSNLFDGIEADKYKHPVFEGVFVRELSPNEIPNNLKHVNGAVSVVFSNKGVPRHNHPEKEAYISVSAVIVETENATARLPKDGWLIINENICHGTVGKTEVISIKFKLPDTKVPSANNIPNRID